MKIYKLKEKKLRYRGIMIWERINFGSVCNPTVRMDIKQWKINQRKIFEKTIENQWKSKEIFRKSKDIKGNQWKWFKKIPNLWNDCVFKNAIRKVKIEKSNWIGVVYCLIVIR